MAYLRRYLLRNLRNLPADSANQLKSDTRCRHLCEAGSMKLLIFVARLRFLDQRSAGKLHHAAFTARSRSHAAPPRPQG